MTTLIKQPSFLEFDAMDRRLRRMLEGVGFVPAVVPAADVYQAGSEFIVELEVPGYEEKELTIEVSDHTLTVTGSRLETKEENAKTFRLHERLEHEFERRFELPPGIDGEHIEAAFEKGVLKVHAPIQELTQPRKVAITKS